MSNGTRGQSQAYMKKRAETTGFSKHEEKGAGPRGKELMDKARSEAILSGIGKPISVRDRKILMEAESGGMAETNWKKKKK